MVTIWLFSRKPILFCIEMAGKITRDGHGQNAFSCVNGFTEGIKPFYIFFFQKKFRITNCLLKDESNANNTDYDKEERKKFLGDM